MTYPISVRAIAEFAHEGGDLLLDFAAAERMREGMEGHITLQRALDASWRAEMPLARAVTIARVTLRIQGRADAVRLGAIPAVEEIKTTGRDPARIREDEYPVHWAQAQIYAAILCRREGAPAAEVALVYYNLSGTKVRFTRSYPASELERLFFEYAEKYANWLAALEVWRGTFQPSVMQLPFPFDTYRDGQRQMAANAYIAVRDRKRVMIEAPTGIGKTAAALYGALKASGEGRVSAIFYLTARTTGRRAAETAVDLMREKGLCARTVTITAKEKACIPGDLDCFHCPYAQGYFDRHRQALMKALSMQKLDEHAIRALAEEYMLCPFELSLGLAETADVIICDYNYAFDPRVRLSRFFARKNSCALLVDEAHNLPERAQDMLSAQLSGREIARLRRDVGASDPLYPALTKAARAFKAGEDEEPEARTLP
ncbi:MAG: ATP-dependent DNA helicase, partial [Christensenellales bacterium]